MFGVFIGVPVLMATIHIYIYIEICIYMSVVLRNAHAYSCSEQSPQCLMSGTYPHGYRA